VTTNGGAGIPRAASFWKETKETASHAYAFDSLCDPDRRTLAAACRL
jgi:hypothetical protein